MQAAIDIPMTVYGTGGQTRGFIHVTDTAKCLQAAVENPPPANGPVEIFNQASVIFCFKPWIECLVENCWYWDLCSI